MPQEFRKWLFIQVGIIAGVLLILAASLWYMRADIGARIKGIREKQTKISIQIRAAGVLAALRRESDEAGPLVSKLESFLPSRDQLIAFSRDLERSAKARSVGFSFGFGAETAATEDAAGSAAFTLTTNGTLGNILMYLEDLEKSTHIIKMESVELSGVAPSYSLVERGRVFFR
ncbi:MAG: hypothetical protein Q8Q41_01250 [bacterium]|nr:hypothetical protein [bacterium]